jgi:A/G-specific adenine glycosylase
LVFKERSKFPWREKGVSAHQLIISETLLQRTKGETVVSFYDKFIKKFQDWHSLAEAKISMIKKNLKPIGLYDRFLHLRPAIMLPEVISDLMRVLLCGK